MALTQSAIAFYGPFTLTAKLGDGSSTSKAYSGLKTDAVTFDVEKKVASVEFEDGTEAEWIEGRILRAEVTFSELVPADLDTLETCNNFNLAFSQSGKTITVGSASGGVEFTTAVAGGKSVVSMKLEGASDSTMASMFSVSS